MQKNNVSAVCFTCQLPQKLLLLSSIHKSYTIKISELKLWFVKNFYITVTHVVMQLVMTAISLTTFFKSVGDNNYYTHQTMTSSSCAGLIG